MSVMVRAAPAVHPAMLAIEVVEAVGHVAVAYERHRAVVAAVGLHERRLGYIGDLSAQHHEEVLTFMAAANHLLLVGNIELAAAVAAVARRTHESHRALLVQDFTSVQRALASDIEG